MSDGVWSELRGQMTDEERIRYRDRLSDEERRKLSEESQDRTIRQLMSGNRGSVEFRLERIEKRLDLLELKK